MRASTTTSDRLQQFASLFTGLGSLSLGPSSNCAHSVRMVLQTHSGTCSAVGKGIGAVVWLSGCYELLEHAVYEGLMTTETRPEVRAAADLHGGGSLALDVVAVLELDSGGSFQATEFQLVGRPSDKVWIPEWNQAGQDPSLRQIYFASTTGWAAGPTVEFALTHALLEIVERDALSRLYAACLLDSPHGQAFTVGAESSLAELVHHVSLRCGRDVELRLLPSLDDSLITVMASAGVEDRFGRLIVGVGTSLTVATATMRALLELDQEMYAEELPYDDDSPFLATGYLDSYTYLARAVRLQNCPPAGNAGTISVDESPLDNLPTLLAVLASRNPIFRVAWSGEVGVVIHAYIPGTERFHMLKHGVPLEPISHLRTDAVLQRCRERTL